MLTEIVLQWTYKFMDQLYDEIHENCYSKNIDETTAYAVLERL